MSEVFLAYAEFFAVGPEVATELPLQIAFHMSMAPVRYLSVYILISSDVVA